MIRCRVPYHQAFGLLILGLAATTPAAGDDEAAKRAAASMLSPLPQATPGKVTYLSAGDLTAAQRDRLMLQNFDESKAQTAAGVKYFHHDVPPPNVDVIANAKSLAKAKAQPQVASIPGASDLSKTPFASLQLVATMTSSRGAANAPNADVVRIFERSDGTTAMLDEWDYVNGGGAIVQIKEALNTDVNGTPATLGALVDPSGRTLWEIGWATDKKSFEIYMTTPLDRENAVRLIRALALSIPDR